MAAGGHGPRPAKQEARAGGPGLGDAKRPAAPPAHGRTLHPAQGRAKTRPQYQQPKSQRGPPGNISSGQGSKRAALRAISTLFEGARGAREKERGGFREKKKWPAPAAGSTTGGGAGPGKVGGAKRAGAKGGRISLGRLCGVLGQPPQAGG